VQQVPLYLSQDRALDDGITSGLLSTSALTRPMKSAEDQAAPAVIMSFPPLAYLLNAVLCVLNQLRECPLMLAREACLQQIARMLEGVCQHLVFNSDDLRTRCTKYQEQILSDSRSRRQKKGLDTVTVTPITGIPNALSTDEDTITPSRPVEQPPISPFGDIHYAKCIAQDVVPHVLYCFDCVFPQPTVTSASKRSAPSLSQGYHVDKLSDRPDILSSDTHQVLASCWQILSKGRLL
jgi:hypothetical protein